MMHKWTGFGLLAVSSLLVACGPNVVADSQVDSVAIPQTPVDNQGFMGFCWAYGGTGLVESYYKSFAGKTVNLSEEALAFFHMAHGIRKLYKTMHGIDLYRALSYDRLPEGWFLRLAPGTADFELTEDDIDGLEIMKRYGVWPESVWSTKGRTAEERATMLRAISKRARDYMNTFDLQNGTIEDVINNVLIGSSAFPSRPPLQFVYEGKTFTPQSFLSSMDFNPDQYAAFDIRGVRDLAKMVTVTKKTLARGISVPMGFPINISRLKNDTFSGKGVPSSTIGDMVNFTREGGHLVLVTDFVNQNGVEGATTEERLRSEVNRSPDDLDYVVFKNSWGLGAKTSESGAVLGGSDSGFYKMDRDYLLGASKVGEYSGWTPLQVIVPKDVLAKPDTF
jgi:hypothetical protein